MPRFSSLPPREIFQDSHLDSMNLMIGDDCGDLDESPWDTITPKSPPVSIHVLGNDALDIYHHIVSEEEYERRFQTQCDDIIKRKEEEREYQRREYQRRIRLEKQQELDSMREIRRINKVYKRKLEQEQQLIREKSHWCSPIRRLSFINVMMESDVKCGDRWNISQIHVRMVIAFIMERSKINLEFDIWGKIVGNFSNCINVATEACSECSTPWPLRTRDVMIKNGPCSRFCCPQYTCKGKQKDTKITCSHLLNIAILCNRPPANNIYNIDKYRILDSVENKIQRTLGLSFKRSSFISILNNHYMETYNRLSRKTWKRLYGTPYPSMWE